MLSCRTAFGLGRVALGLLDIGLGRVGSRNFAPMRGQNQQGNGRAPVLSFLLFILFSRSYCHRATQ